MVGQHRLALRRRRDHAQRHAAGLPLQQRHVLLKLLEVQHLAIHLLAVVCAETGGELRRPVLRAGDDQLQRIEYPVG